MKKLWIAVLFWGSMAWTYGQMPFGSADDMHGCDGTAGLVYSALLKECIRPAGLGIQLINTDTAGTLLVGGAILFSDDGKKAEIFIPGPRKSLVLKKVSENAWKKGDYELVRPGKYLLKKAGIDIYREK